MIYMYTNFILYKYQWTMCYCFQIQCYCPTLLTDRTTSPSTPRESNTPLRIIKVSQLLYTLHHPCTLTASPSHPNFIFPNYLAISIMNI